MTLTGEDNVRNGGNAGSTRSRWIHHESLGFNTVLCRQRMLRLRSGYTGRICIVFVSRVDDDNDFNNNNNNNNNSSSSSSIVFPAFNISEFFYPHNNNLPLAI